MRKLATPKDTDGKNIIDDAKYITLLMKGVTGTKHREFNWITEELLINH